VLLEFNTDLSHSWSKDFKETKYLGGSVQGDWNPAVSRTGTLKAVVTADDTDTIEAMRRLATYAGICHVRTKDGSSYAADVQVSESYAQDSAHKIVTFNLSITRVDSDGYDGMTYAEWSEADTGYSSRVGYARVGTAVVGG
jgi:translation initiation factor IF-2